MFISCSTLHLCYTPYKEVHIFDMLTYILPKLCLKWRFFPFRRFWNIMDILMIAYFLNVFNLHCRIDEVNAVSGDKVWYNSTAIRKHSRSWGITSRQLTVPFITQKCKIKRILQWQVIKIFRVHSIRIHYITNELDFQ